MTVTALVVAVVALLLAFAASRKASELADQLLTVRRDLLSKDEQLDEASKTAEITHRLLGLIAAGHAVDPLMVREKRLFRVVTTDALRKEFESGVRPYVIDVRSDQEWRSGHLEGAVHIPFDALEKRMNEVRRDGTKMFLVCAGGSRSAEAARMLANRGYLNVHNVEGGMNAWKGPVARD